MTASEIVCLAAAAVGVVAAVYATWIYKLTAWTIIDAFDRMDRRDDACDGDDWSESEDWE